MGKKYFNVVAIDHAIDGGTDSKAPQVIVRLKVVDGPEAGAEKMYYGSLHENAAEYTFEALRSLGWSCNDVEKLTGLGSLKAVAVEDDHKYNGKTSRRIKFINPWRAKTIKTSNPVPKGLGTRFKTLAANVKVDVDPELAKAPSKEELDRLQPAAAPVNAPVDDNPFA